MILRDFRGASALATLVPMALLLLVGTPAFAKKGAKKATASATASEALVSASTWLVLEPVEVPLPAFHQGNEAEVGKFDIKDLLDVALLPPEDLWPQAGDSVALVGSSEARWKSVGAEVTLAAPQQRPTVTHLAAYISADRFLTAELQVSGPGHLQASMGGEELDLKAGGDDGLSKSDVNLSPGKHLLILKVVQEHSDENDRDGRVTVSLAASGDASEEHGTDLSKVVSFSTDPNRPVRLGDFVHRQQVRGVALSAGGDWLAVQWRDSRPHPIAADSWSEILDVANGRILRTLRGGEESFSWAPAGDSYAYVTTAEEESDLWLGAVGSGEVRRVASKIKGLQEYRWLPDGKSMLLVVAEEKEADERGIKRLRGLRDRVTGYRDHSHLYQLDLSTSSQRRLTAGAESIGLHDISPDGSRILFSTTPYDLNTRPFNRGELYEMDLSILEPKKLSSIIWLGGATYQPGGDEILIHGGPSAFGRLGNALAEGKLANDYDGQLYFLNRSTGDVRPLTKDFDPAVESATWAGGDHLVVRAQQGSRIVPFRYDLATSTFTVLESGMDVVRGLAVSRQGNQLAAFGESVSEPLALTSRSVRDGGQVQNLLPESVRISDPAYVVGEVEDWSFEAPGGTIPGRIYYPPGFDAGEKYPMIVYYYGGTVPTDRTWGSRWPWHLWASLGYVVYVSQPSGATGYGQERSARHLNNWGKTSAEEIIQGTQELLDSRPYLDEERVGCLGASYGGFMTMYLLTRTDLFSAAISHAGISSLSSYWGEGWWGYSYSSVASAASYPWNNPKLYVEQSPLFNADKIHTPLLLLHGDADTNVPVGESQQMYTALEILGRDVEFVTLDGENHRIAGAEHQEIWIKSILAWFEWKLKGQPEWWQHLYGDEGDPKG